jgi:23S rRNA (guanine745-N1)-methyltransferase
MGCSHSSNRHFCKPGHSKIETLLNQNHSSSCVDLGCGEGYYTNHLSNAFEHIQFIGLDLSKTALKLASKHSNVKYFCASIADTPIDDHSVDCALCIFAPFKIEEVIRILKPNAFPSTYVKGTASGTGPKD